MKEYKSFLNHKIVFRCDAANIPEIGSGHVYRSLVIAKFLKTKHNYIPKTVISLQANTPEFKSRDLDKALEFFNKKLYVRKPIKELISVNPDNVQNGAFRIMTYRTVFQKTLSTKVGIFKTNYIDIHNMKEYLKVKKIIEK